MDAQTMSYTAMASSTETMASSSVGGVPPLRYPPPGLPPLEPAPMDTLLAPTSENLLATAGVGRGGRGLRQPRTPTAPGLLSNETHGPTTEDAHPRKAGGKPGDPLQAASLPASTHHWGANDHH